MSILGALQRPAVLQGAFVKIADFTKFKDFLVEFPENRRSWENKKPPENRQKSGLFWASPFTMHLVCTLSKEKQTILHVSCCTFVLLKHWAAKASQPQCQRGGSSASRFLSFSAQTSCQSGGECSTECTVAWRCFAVRVYDPWVWAHQRAPSPVLLILDQVDLFEKREWIWTCEPLESLFRKPPDTFNFLQQNPCAHKNKIGTSPPSNNNLKYPSQNEEFYGHGFFL